MDACVTLEALFKGVVSVCPIRGYYTLRTNGANKIKLHSVVSEFPASKAVGTEAEESQLLEAALMNSE
jgi:hypothetical protein